ncbi:hypothetical protein SMC3_04575 [Candidatus Cryosericum hinesii]|jgi:hypothetical protein|uniref:Uncharacterized protein n=1 Tax=Candidatus Cryosericum hinesii TaxID=2290915 RepID=A0A398DCU9_9BACT|nr:hypothetical protein [Candidatus Cryosericum hinesii]RIE13282.1 hypothetical protein SMC3_04575 [Candidatus Cryosericum hinesii]RIE15680.1 hypothetical protein SMC2_00165 [Candidatus Cryosericum hinesii]
MGEGKLAEFPARTILEVLFTKDPSALLSATTRAARYDVVVGRSGIRYASRGQLGGETALFLLLMETDGTFALGPVTSDYGSNCVFQNLSDVDARFAEWKKRLTGTDLRFLDPGRLYWWRSKLNKDVQQLAAPEYDIAQLTRDRAQTADSLASVLGLDVLEVSRTLSRMTRQESFEIVPFVRSPRQGTYRSVVASRDALLANAFWQNVCGGEMPLQWDSHELLYRRTVSHPAYDLSTVFVMQVLDDTMKDMVRLADVLFFLLSDLPSDEERYLADLRALNPTMSVFFWGSRRRKWARRVQQSVHFTTPLEREAVLQALDVFL